MLGAEAVLLDDDGEQLQRRQQLINFAHAQWGFNNWSWSVSKQDLDFVDFSNGKYCAGVAAFVTVTVKTFDIHRENIGYATSVAHNKGLAIWKSRKSAVTNALRETLLSFGGNVATELLEVLESSKNDVNHPPPVAAVAPAAEPPAECSAVKTVEPKNKHLRKEAENANLRPPPKAPLAANLPPANRPPVANAPRPPGPPVPPVPQVPQVPQVPLARPNSNVSFVLQPVMGGVVPPLYAPRLPPPSPLYPNAYYEYSAGPWHFTYESFDRHHGNVNLNFNLPPKNLVVNGRASAECKNACGIRPPGPEGEPLQYGPPPQNQGCWIKPTIFYDGFWTEQKVKKWVAEQVEKQFPEDPSQKSPSPSNGQPDPSGSKS